MQKKEKICLKENNHAKQYLRDLVICLRSQSYSNFTIQREK